MELNCSTAYPRNMTECPVDDFKEALDKYLGELPDEPAGPGFTPSGCTSDGKATNSILWMKRAERT